MDLARAKSVIIAFLLAFNIFLLYNVFAFSAGRDAHGETLKNTELILGQRGVVLECDIPSAPNANRLLKYGRGSLDREEMAKKLLGGEYERSNGSNGEIFVHGSKKIEFASETGFTYSDGQPAISMDIRSGGKISDAAGKFLQEKGLLDGNYVVDDVRRNEDGSVSVHFIEEYENMLLYDNYCTVTINKNGVERIEFNKLQIDGLKQGRSGNSEAYRALLSRFRSTNETIIITGIDIGYKLDDESPAAAGQTWVEISPVWRVKMKGRSEPIYIKADISENAG